MENLSLFETKSRVKLIKNSKEAYEWIEDNLKILSATTLAYAKYRAKLLHLKENPIEIVPVYISPKKEEVDFTKIFDGKLPLPH